MRKSVISELFFARTNDELSEKCRRILLEKAAADEVLRNDLTPAQTEIYLQCCNAGAEFEGELAKENFAEGFRQGLLVGLEIVDI